SGGKAWSVRICPLLLFEHRALAQIDHVEHVARVVDVVWLTLSYPFGAEESISVGRCGTVVHWDPARSHQQAQVELLELVFRRLVDRRNDRLASATCKIGE